MFFVFSSPSLIFFFNIEFGYNRPMSISLGRLIRSRRKTIALIVERDGSVTVRAPLRMSEARILDFVESHRDWIDRNQARVLSAGPMPSKSYMQGELFLFLGKTFPLNILPRQRPALTFDGENFKMSESALPKAEAAFIHWYKAQAAAFILERASALALKHGFHYQKIRISSARTRWGSCSSRGTISFTYRLIMAPPEVVDYVIMHELVHIQIHNHSRKFWGRLEELIPGYKNQLSWLKQNGKYLV